MKRDWCLHWTLPVAQAQINQFVHCYHLNNEHCAASLNAIVGKGQPTVVAYCCFRPSAGSKSLRALWLRGLRIRGHRGLYLFEHLAWLWLQSARDHGWHSRQRLHRSDPDAKHVYSLPMFAGIKELQTALFTSRSCDMTNMTHHRSCVE